MSCHVILRFVSFVFFGRSTQCFLCVCVFCFTMIRLTLERKDGGGVHRGGIMVDTTTCLSKERLFWIMTTLC